MKSTDKSEIDLTRNITAEKEIIGTVIKAPIFVQQAMALHAEDFSDPAHQVIWRAIAHQLDKNDDINLGSVSAICGSKLSNSNRSELEHSILRSSGAEGVLIDAIRAVKDASKRRNAAKIYNKARHEVVTSESSLDTIVSKTSVEAEKAITDETSVFMDGRAVNKKLRKRLENPLLPVPTGIRKLDHVLEGGLMPTKMLAIVAQTKHGKTTFASTVSYNLFMRKEPHLVITLERNETDIEQACAARALKINMLELERDFPKYQKAYDKYEQNPFHAYRKYDHNPDATIEDIQASVMRAHREGARGFILDYWQLIKKPPRESAVEHLSRCAQTLANLCSRLNMWSIVNAQSHADGLPRECQALWLASPTMYVIRREGPSKPETWLQCMGSSYTKGFDAGSPGNPAMMLNTDIGPYFEGT